MGCLSILQNLVKHILELVAKEYGDDRWWCFIATQSLIVSDIGCRYTKQIIPAVVKYTTVLAESVNQVRAAGKTYNVSVQEKLLEKTSALLAESYEALNHLAEVTAEIEKKEEGPERARYCLDVIMPAMTELRTPVDALEMIVDKEMWPMPSYGDLMFIL